MSVATAKMRLMAATRDLRINWSIATQQWNDPASRAFEKNHLSLFERQVRSTITALDEMQETMQAMYRECGDD